MKKKLLRQRSLFFKLLLTNLFVFSIAADFAATKTWNGGTGTGKDWNVAGNWTPSGIPASGDDIVFSTAGTITFSAMPTAIFSYGSLYVSGTSAVTFVGGSACNLSIGGGAPDPDLSIGGTASLTLGANVNLTMANNANGNISGFFYIGTSAPSTSTFNTNGSGVVTNVFGTLQNLGTVNGSLSTLIFEDGCVYRHSRNGGVIPTGTWNTNAFCIIAGLIDTHPTNAVQPYGNLTYNSPGMTADITMPAGISVANDFQIYNTGTGRVLMAPGTLNVGRDFVFSTNPEALVIASTANSTMNVGRDVTVSGSANLNFCTGGAGVVGTMNVAGSFVSFGGVTETGAGKGQLNFVGSSAQIFNQSGAFVNNIGIGINNPAGVTFSGGSVTINDALTLTNGVLTIPAGNTLTIANGNVIGGSPGSGTFINTQVSGATQAFVRIDNMAAGIPYVVPTGNGTSYLPVTLTPGDASSFSVGVFTGITQNGLPNGTAFTALMKQGCVNAVWTVNRNTGTLGTNMTLGWPSALEGSSFATYTTNQIGIAHWDNPAWGNCIGTGDNSANTATRPGVTLFSPFSVGKTPYVLPIKFSYVNAAKTNGSNTVYWQAACSSSAVTFNVERSTDGVNFSTINSVSASQLRCAQPFNYVDNNGSAGNIFYRIRSEEVTGVVTYSSIVKLTDQQRDMQLKAVVPNPVIDQAQLSITSAQKDEMSLVVISMDGKIVQQSKIQLQAGSSIVNLDVSTLQKGVYMVKGTFSNGESNTLKFIKQ